MNNAKQKYVFLYLKTGGGHLAPARSVAQYIKKKFSEKADPILINGFEKTPEFFRYLIEDGYRKLQYKAQWFYETLYAINKFPPMGFATAQTVSFFCKKYIEEVLLETKPDKIIILHFFLIKPVYDIVKKYNLKTEIFTVVTDPYTAHPLWLIEKKQNFIVFSERIRELISQKRSQSRIIVFPFILDEKFSQTISSEKISLIKKELGLPEGKKVILILGGGDGIPHGKKILETILKEKLNAVTAIVCGKNKSLFEAAHQLKQKYNESGLIIYGFVDFVYELLNAADIVVTKCGASTMMEILMMRKVPVVNDYIWEQEKGNVEFLIENDFGIYEPGIEKIPAVLKKLITDEEFYLFYKNNISNYNLENGTSKIAEYLME